MSGSDATLTAASGREGMIHDLAAVGLNLFACLAGRDLIARKIPGIPALEDGASSPGTDRLKRQSVLLIGNAGPAFWAACQASDLSQEPDPVDRYSARQVTEALTRFVPDIPHRLLYPASDCAIALQSLGAMAGWHQPSPLGIGMHPQAGLWFAYRAVVLLDAEWAPTAAPESVANYCAECKTQDCIQTCPADALSMGDTPDLGRCGNFRLEENSPCQDQCLARIACPVFTELRYSREQVRHHYVASLDALRRYIQQTTNDV
ncbi:MAG: hypothetical protein KTR32_14090 [Granulosicoccus sp.]|nr:hypothetical protein [Granulosicoccus sp.]